MSTPRNGRRGEAVGPPFAGRGAVPARRPGAPGPGPFGFALLDIMVRPRSTIRRILAGNPRRWVLFLIVVEAAVGVPESAQELTSQLPPFLALAFALGTLPPLAVASVYLWTGLFSLFARLLGGRASGVELRAAWVWGSAPSLLAGVLTCAVGLVAGSPGLGWRGLVPLDATAAALVFQVVGWLVLASAAYTAVLMLICVSEAQRFSPLRSFVAVVLTAAAIGTALLSLLLLAAFLA